MTAHLNILVTGGSSGIGKATALELAKRGHHVIASARRVALLEELERTEKRICALALDVTYPESIRSVVEQVDELTARHGIDVLINSAGYALFGPLEALCGDALRHQFETNVFGLLDLTRAFLPQMRARQSGRI